MIVNVNLNHMIQSKIYTFNDKTVERFIPETRPLWSQLTLEQSLRLRV